MGYYLLLIVVGLAIIIVSFFLSEKVMDKKEIITEDTPKVNEEYLNQLLEENKKKLQTESEKIVEDTINVELNHVDEQLAHISNEKIMAVNEFSDQLLEKIEENHKEVVFLYDMLNEKENEMKAFVQEIDKSKVVLEELANKELEKQKMLQHKRIKKELEKQMRQQEQYEKDEMELKRSGVLTEDESKTEIQASTPPKAETQMSALERMGNQLEEAPTEEETPVVETQKVEEQEQMIVTEQQEDANQNQVILNLYNEGKSIMEIAKLLGKGQGEVKLVIDLFQGARR